MTHPRDILLGAQAATVCLPVCDHCDAVEARLGKISLAFASAEGEIKNAVKITAAAAREDGVPSNFEGQWHDRASHRYFWPVSARADQTGRVLPPKSPIYFLGPS